MEGHAAREAASAGRAAARPAPATIARWTTWATVALFFAGLWLIARPTADFLRYFEWARVAESSDIFALHGATRSPFGVPFSHWTHGTGFAFAAVRSALGGLVGRFNGALLAGWLGAVAFWAATYRLLAHLGRRDWTLTWFGCGLAFSGTHAGFYTFSTASESFSLACLAVIAYWVIVPRQWTARDALVLGAAGGLLTVVRAQLLVYVALALGVFAHALWTTRRERRTRGSLLLVALALGPVLLGLGQVALVNRWMTGSPLGSPYYWGDAEFRSLDFARPEIRAVLLHAWHGLLVYHPAYALGAAALGCRALRRGPRGPRALAAATLAVLAAHGYLQAAHFSWWLGTATFGMRGLAVAAVILVPALIAELAWRDERGRAVTPWMLLGAACALWSYLLLRQLETNFVSYGQLLAAQLAQLRKELAPVNLVPALVCFAGAGIAAGSRARAGASSAIRRATAVGIASLGFLAVLNATFEIYPPAARLAPASALLIKALIAALVPVAAWAAPDTVAPPSRRLFEPAAAVGFVGVFVLVTVAFVRLAARTETMDARAAAGRAFRYHGTLDWGEVEATYREYLLVPGFEAKKRKLEAFLERWREAQ